MDFGPFDYYCTGSTIESIEAIDFDEALEAYISARVDVGVWALKVPQKASIPCVVYTIVTEDHLHTLQSAAGLVSAEVQIDSYASTRAASKLISEEIRGILDGFRGDMNGVYVSGILLGNRFTEQDPGISGDDESTWVTRCQYTALYSESIPQN